jgi:hypothetical protein
VVSCGHTTRSLRSGREGSLVVLLLAERARSECARSMRAIEDQPDCPVKRDMIEVGGRGLGMCSVDTRSEGQPGHLPREDFALLQRECVLLTYNTASNGLKLRSVQGVLSIFRLACSRSRSFLRSISNSAIADVLSLSMPHMLRMYCFVRGWKRISLTCSMKHTLVPGLMPSFRRSRAGMKIRPLVVT